MFSRSVLTAAFLSIAAFSANPAEAGGWPASVAGNWSVVANNSPGTMAINQPASTAPCRPINGTIFGNPLRGFYCPSSGRIAFHRLRPGQVVYQYYTGNLAMENASQPARIGGNFSDLSDPGEYSFFATK